MRIEAALIETLGHPLRPFAYEVGPVRYVPEGETLASRPEAL